MFYNKEYFLSDYLSYENMNELISKVRQLLNIFQDKVDLSDTSKYDITMVEYELNDFPYVEDIDKIERNIMNLGYDFIQPPGYIQNKVWKDRQENVYKSFSYIDINRMINDMNLLYEYKNDTSTKYNLESNEYWNGSSTLNWEE